MLALYILLPILAWVAIGAKLVWMYNHHTQIGSHWNRQPMFFAALSGPFVAFLIHEMHHWSGRPRYEPLYIELADRKNPLLEDLKEAIRAYRYIQFVPGEESAREREKLEAVIKELRAWPEKASQYDGDKLMAAYRRELQQIFAGSEARLKAFESVEREALNEVRQIEGPP